MPRRPLRAQPLRGQGMTEYAVILALLAVVVLAVLGVVGRSTANAVCSTTTGLGGAGKLYTWGDNSWGELGTGSGGNTATPSLVSSVCASQMAAGWRHTLALKPDGTVWAWGDNSFGELGPGAGGATSSTPVQVTGLPSVAQVSAGMDFSVALSATGQVYVWGLNIGGVLYPSGTLAAGAYCDQSSHPTPVAVPLPGGARATSIAASQFGVIVTASDGRLYAWGDTTQGESGTNLTSGPNVFTGAPCTFGAANETVLTSVQPVVGLTASSVKQLVADGAPTVYALLTNGTVDAWGYNAFGEVGNNAYTSVLTPVPVAGPGCSGTLGTTSPIVSIAPELYAGIALDSGGNVYTWGADGTLFFSGIEYGWGGELGDGDTTMANKPCPVRPVQPGGGGVLPRASAIGGSDYEGLALLADGRLVAWGTNHSGEIGDSSVGTPTGNVTPVVVKNVPNAPVVQITGGNYSVILSVT